MYKLMHTGYPVAGRRIEDGEWKLLSTHKTLSAAHKKYRRRIEHLSQGSWDDHYKIIAPDGHIVEQWEIDQMLYDSM